MVDLVEEEDDMDNEQAALDGHDDRDCGLFDHRALIAAPKEGKEKPKPDLRQSLQRSLQHLQGNLCTFSETVSAGYCRQGISGLLPIREIGQVAEWLQAQTVQHLAEHPVN